MTWLQKLNFQIALMILKFVCWGSIICIVSIKIRFKAIHHLQSLENLLFLLPPLILRLYTGCRQDQNFSKSTLGFQKLIVLNYSGYKCPSFLKLAVFLLRMRTKYTKNCDACHWKDETGVFQFVFRCSPLDLRCPFDNWTS